MNEFYVPLYITSQSTMPEGTSMRTTIMPILVLLATPTFLALPARAQVINPILSELVHDHLGASDTHEYIEIYASPGGDYSDHSVLVLDGESSGNPGRIDLVFALETTNGSGYWDTGFLVDQLDKASFTVLLVEGFSGLVGDDLDAADDGSLDSAPWIALLDDVAIDSGVAGDLVYSSVVLGGVGRGPAAPGAASRYPYATDTDSAGDWWPNNFEGAGLPGFAGTLASGEVLNTPGRVPQILISDYYAGIFALDSATLRAALHELIDDHIRFAYTDDVTDTWDVLEEADQDPVDSGSILAVYKNETYLKQGGGNSFYNREHTWPRTYGFPDDGLDNMPYTDCHQLMLSNIDYNSQRGSIAFGTCNASCAELTTDLNHGTGGGSGTYPGNSNWATGSGATGSFEVWHEMRGDVARAQLYLDLRYAGGSHGVTGFSEPDLILTDDTGQIVGGTASVAYMGRLSVLLAWHAGDPVDDRERLRNEVIYSYQGNRNPFIDRPEWASCVFGAACGGIFADGFESGDLTAW